MYDISWSNELNATKLLKENTILIFWQLVINKQGEDRRSLLSVTRDGGPPSLRPAGSSHVRRGAISGQVARGGGQGAASLNPRRLPHVWCQPTDLGLI